MSAPVSVTLNPRLIEAAQKAAREAGLSLEAFAEAALEHEIERLRTERFFEERRARANIPAALAILNRQGGQEPSPEDAMPG